jgi:CRP/FNR family transcriptional regulator
VGLSTPDLERLDGLVAQRRHIPRGEDLFRTGERFAQVYAVRSGFFKTGLMLEDGREQVTGFQMTGELLGLDGISTDAHTVTATALEDSQVCVIPFDQLEELSREFNDLQRQFHKIMSREIVRATRGYSSSEVVLRMTREEIGSYLGLKLETVSRTFSRFQEDGLLDVKQRQIRILQQERLKDLVGATTAC